MNKPIFILGAHKSGTSLLRSLFDGVKSIFVIPVEAHFFQHIGWWVDYALRKKVPESFSGERFVDNIKAFIRELNESDEERADSVPKGIFDIGRFDDFIDCTLNETVAKDAELRIYFEAYVKAIYHSVNDSELDIRRRVVEKSVENAEFASDLQSMFPDATFIHIVRNPYANIVSTRKFMSDKCYPWLGPIYRSLYNSYYFLYRNKRTMRNYMVIRYEDLVIDTRELMENICDFANLEFSESMLTPTYLEEPWQGNSTYRVKFGGISVAHLDKWKREITPLEVDLINRYLKHVVSDFGYNHITTTKSVLLPIRKEPFLHYVANRFVWRVG